MNQPYNPLQMPPERPGIGKPVFLGSVLGVAIYAGIGWLPAIGGGPPCVCCSPIAGMAAGFFAALLAQRREPMIGISGAFVVGVLAAGVTGLLAGGVLATFLTAPAELDDIVREGLRELEKEDPGQFQFSEEDRRDAVVLAREAFRYLPVWEAATNLLAGVAASLITSILVAGKRQPPPHLQGR